jgi:hypothetical protein
VTQAKLGTNVVGNGPAFSATYNGTFSVANNTYVKAVFNTVGTNGFNLGGYFDYTTNYRFTPLVAGYYQINLQCSFVTFGSGYGIAFIYKNGVGTNINSSTTNGQYPSPCVSGILYLNGSTDYIEAYAYQNSGGTVSCYAQYFNACLIRSA